MMTQLIELGLQPTTVFALRYSTIHSFVCTMLILECLFPPFISALQGPGQVKSLPGSLPSFHVPRTLKNIISPVAMEEWLLVWGNSARDYSMLSTEKGQLAAVQRVLGASGCCKVGLPPLPLNYPSPCKAEAVLGVAQSQKGSEGPSQTLVQ